MNFESISVTVNLKIQMVVCWGFFSRQELHDPVIWVLCFCMEVIFMDNSLHGFAKSLVSGGAPLLTCRLSGPVEVLSSGGIPCFSCVLGCLNFSFRARTPGRPWDF